MSSGRYRFAPSVYHVLQAKCNAFRWCKGFASFSAILLTSDLIKTELEFKMQHLHLHLHLECLAESNLQKCVGINNLN